MTGMRSLKRVVCGLALVVGGERSAWASPVQWTIGSGGNGQRYELIFTPDDGATA